MRRKNDFYPTESAVTQVLLNSVQLSESILECCAGNSAIANVLRAQHLKTYTNDIDKRWDCDYYGDATKAAEWNIWKEAGYCDWVVTNPPFNQAHLILPLAYEHAKLGVAMLLRLSYLEPCENRGVWLQEHPPSALIILGQPRPCFTGDGKTDSCTTAWMVWRKNWRWDGWTDMQFVFDWKTKKKS